MSKAVEKLLSIARKEIGYLEKETNTNLDDKTANAGDKNWNKYARDLDKTNLYNGKKNGYSWCDIWTDWCFVQAFGFEMALNLTCQPTKGFGAGCTNSAQYYKNKGQFHTSNPKPGDQIFFTNDNGKTFYHTGIVEKVTSDRIYTIEGNTSSSPGVVANGGAVRDKYYSLSYKYIGGYGRPDYSLVDGKSTVNSGTVKPSLVIKAPSITYKPTKLGTIINGSSINVRTGPGISYNILGTIIKDSEITILGTDSTKKWYNFKNAEYSNAWISATYVSITLTVLDAPYTYTPARNGVVSTLLELNVRIGPGTNYDIIGSLKNGTIIQIIGLDTNQKWYKIECSQYGSGWVRASYIKFKSFAVIDTKTGIVTAKSGLKALSGPGTSYKQVGGINYGATVTVFDTDGDYCKVTATLGWGNITNVWVNAKYVKINNSSTVSTVSKTATAYLHLRAGRGTNYASLAIIPKGASVTAQNLVNGWYYVNYNGITGYSNANYLK